VTLPAHAAQILGTGVCGCQRHCPDSEPGERRALSLSWEISLPHGQSPVEGGEINADMRLGEFPTIIPLDRLCASAKLVYRIHPLGLSPYNLSLVRFGHENCVPRIASDGFCPSVQAHRCRGKLNLQAFFKGQKTRKNTDIAKDIFLFTNDMNKIVIY